MNMQATFFFVGIFPPPSAGPEIVARLNGPCTGRATDTYKSPVVQRIIGHTIFLYIFLYIFSSPVKERMIFNDLVCFIPFNYRKIFTVGGMLGTQAGYPNCIACQCPS